MSESISTAKGIGRTPERKNGRLRIGEVSDCHSVIFPHCDLAMVETIDRLTTSIGICFRLHFNGSSSDPRTEIRPFCTTTNGLVGPFQRADGDGRNAFTIRNRIG